MFFAAVIQNGRMLNFYCRLCLVWTLCRGIQRSRDRSPPAVFCCCWCCVSCVCAIGGVAWARRCTTPPGVGRVRAQNNARRPRLCSVACVRSRVCVCGCSRSLLFSSLDFTLQSSPPLSISTPAAAQMCSVRAALQALDAGALIMHTHTPLLSVCVCAQRKERKK